MKYLYQIDSNSRFTNGILWFHDTQSNHKRHALSLDYNATRCISYLPFNSLQSSGNRQTTCLTPIPLEVTYIPSVDGISLFLNRRDFLHRSTIQNGICCNWKDSQGKVKVEWTATWMGEAVFFHHPSRDCLGRISHAHKEQLPGPLPPWGELLQCHHPDTKTIGRGGEERGKGIHFRIIMFDFRRYYKFADWDLRGSLEWAGERSMNWGLGDGSSLFVGRGQGETVS